MNSLLKPTVFPSKFALNFLKCRYIPRTNFIPLFGFKTVRNTATIAWNHHQDDERKYFNTKKRIRDKSHGEWQEGKLSPTTSRLFKLIIPLPRSTPPSPHNVSHVAYLLHPSQPLSHVSNLIAASLASTLHNVDISFRSVPPDESSDKDIEVEWSDATDLGDFIKSVVSKEHFDVVISPRTSLMTIDTKARNAKPPSQGNDSEPSLKDINTKGTAVAEGSESIVIKVKIPSFQDRTQFLRRRLQSIDTALNQMEPLKQECDREAHRSARRLAVSGFGTLVIYWFGVARLTFYDYGWDIMEPITYLSGLSTVICGYLWFLYKGREVSYTSVLSQSVSTRRLALYKAKGFDLERWADLITERTSIRREMDKIAEDYDTQWDGRWEDKAHNGTSKDEEKEQIKEETIQPNTDTSSSRRDHVGKAIAVGGDNDGHDKLEELDMEASRERRNHKEV